MRSGGFCAFIHVVPFFPMIYFHNSARLRGTKVGLEFVRHFTAISLGDENLAVWFQPKRFFKIDRRLQVLPKFAPCNTAALVSLQKSGTVQIGAIVRGGRNRSHQSKGVVIGG